MKLFYSPGACSLADHAALIEAGLPYELKQVDLKTKRTADGQDYLAVNPKGYVPALRLDSGDTLTENIAILSWIAHESGRLQPADGPGRWHVLEAAVFVSTELHKNFKPFFAGAPEDQKGQAREVLAKRFAIAAEMIGGRDFLVGDELSIADCYLFVMLTWAGKFHLDLPAPLPAYLERLRARPAFQRALREEGLA